MNLKLTLPSKRRVSFSLPDAELLIEVLNLKGQNLLSLGNHSIVENQSINLQLGSLAI
jgi:hypothetical protein